MSSPSFSGSATPIVSGASLPLFDVQLTPEVAIRPFLPGNLKPPTPLSPALGTRHRALLGS
ncbi:MAG: hypothetical protein HIU88_06710 [Acidobacteria bacterium]|nr:hypothetical protein [Acidobacteriota bacterium]